MNKLANMVSVYGSGVKGPLLQTDDARLIQFRDANGDLMAMMVQIGKGLWGFVTRDDPDWDDTVKHSAIDDSKAV